MNLYASSITNEASPRKVSSPLQAFPGGTDSVNQTSEQDMPDDSEKIDSSLAAQWVMALAATEEFGQENDIAGDTQDKTDGKILCQDEVDGCLPGNRVPSVREAEFDVEFFKEEDGSITVGYIEMLLWLEGIKAYWQLHPIDGFSASIYMTDEEAKDIVNRCSLYCVCSKCGMSNTKLVPCDLDQLESQKENLCEKCFFMKFPNGFEESNSIPYFDKSETDILSKCKNDIYQIIDESMSKFLQEYDPEIDDKNLVNLMTVERLNCWTFLKKREHLYLNRVIANLDMTKIEDLANIYNNKLGELQNKLDEYISRKGAPVYPKYELIETFGLETKRPVNFYRNYDAKLNPAYWKQKVISPRIIVSHRIRYSTDFFNEISKKFSDVIRNRESNTAPTK